DCFVGAVTVGNQAASAVIAQMKDNTALPDDAAVACLLPWARQGMAIEIQCLGGFCGTAAGFDGYIGAPFQRQPLGCVRVAAVGFSTGLGGQAVGSRRSRFGVVILALWSGLQGQRFPSALKQQ